MLANSGLEAKAVRLSTASIRGPVAALHFSLFSWLKAPSKACTGDMVLNHNFPIDHATRTVEQLMTYVCNVTVLDMDGLTFPGQK